MFMYPELQSIFNQMLDLEWNYTRLALTQNKHTGERSLDRIWIDPQAKELYDYLAEMAGRHIAKVRQQQAYLSRVFRVVNT